jgi:Na+/H+ antiporter NhaA
MTSQASQTVTEEAQTRGVPRAATIREFLFTEAGGAVVLLGATVAALVWANSPWRDLYNALWDTVISLRVGDFELALDLGHWINDGLMTLFFLLVGLEIRREFDMGEFRERRRLAVPVLAAVGGMVLPVILFLAFTAGTEDARGWAMVMATDTAFAVGVLALVGRRSSMRLRIFLLTLVIVDDVAAVSVIALFYSDAVQPVALGIAVALVAIIGLLRWRGIGNALLLVVLGLGAWLATYQAGVHPTVAGVAIGLLTGAHPPRRTTLQEAIGVARAFRREPSPALASAATRSISASLSPNDRLQHAIHPWSSYFVVPLFALANAGIDVSGDVVGRIIGSSLTIGIIVGLVVGKTVGIPLGAWLATRQTFGGLPLAVGWPQLIAASAVAGIGFTVSLLIAQLSYTLILLEEAKLGILIASALAALLSIGMFYGLSRLPAARLRRAEAQAAPPLNDLVEAIDPVRDHIRGPVDAPVTIVEYADFECPHCRRATPVLKELLGRHPGQIRLVFRHLPLTDVHANAALAAVASEAAAAQGKFWEMHDILFANQDDLMPADLKRYAAKIGLDVERFERDLLSERFDNRVAQDIDSADAAGVAGTPTFFINDVLYRGARTREAFEAEIGAALLVADDAAAEKAAEQATAEEATAEDAASDGRASG